MYALGHELANTPSHKFELTHMRVLLNALDHPERRFPSALIRPTPLPWQPTTASSPFSGSWMCGR